MTENIVVTGIALAIAAAAGGLAAGAVYAIQTTMRLIGAPLLRGFDAETLRWNTADLQNDNDPCVLCGRDSGIPRTTPIAQRSGYVEGSGPTCSKHARAINIGGNV